MLRDLLQLSPKIDSPSPVPAHMSLTYKKLLKYSLLEKEENQELSISLDLANTTQIIVQQRVNLLL